MKSMANGTRVYLGWAAGAWWEALFQAQLAQAATYSLTYCSPK